MVQQDRRHVLAANAGLDALGLAIEARRLAHEEAGDVEHMDAEVENDEVLHLGQIRLLAVDVVPGAERDARPGRLADRTGINDLTDLSHRLQKAGVLMHHKGNAGGAGSLYYGDAIL